MMSIGGDYGSEQPMTMPGEQGLYANALPKAGMDPKMQIAMALMGQQMKKMGGQQGWPMPQHQPIVDLYGNPIR